MTITLILLAGILTVLLGRWMFGRWFNHVGLYGVVWGSSLALFATDLIRYYPMTAEAWIIIVVGWVGFVLGSGCVVAARFSITDSNEKSDRGAIPDLPFDLRVLTIALLVLNVVVILDMMNLIRAISSLIGGLNNYFKVANIVYSIRAQGGIPGAIPYISASALAGCLLGGIYVARVGGFRLVAFMPLVVITINSMLSMDRWMIITAAVLFGCGFAFESRKQNHVISKKLKFRRIVLAAIAIGLFGSGIEFVRSHRGITEDYSTAASSLARLQGGSLITPSVFFYFTGSIAVLNQYLKKDIEHEIVGRYTLAPVWRTISKLGFDTEVESAQTFYYTPIVGNNGTYLREFHADYGIVGVALGPFVFGFVVTLFWFRAIEKRRLFDLMILGHLFVVIAMSIFHFATQLGAWLASIIVGSVLAVIIDRNSMSIQPFK